MGIVTLFVYGSLKSKKIIGKETGSPPLKTSKYVLQGYKKCRVKGFQYPVLMKEPKSNVSGVVHSLTQKQIKILDEYETYWENRSDINWKRNPLYLRKKIRGFYVYLPGKYFVEKINLRTNKKTMIRALPKFSSKKRCTNEIPNNFGINTSSKH